MYLIHISTIYYKYIIIISGQNGPIHDGIPVITKCTPPPPNYVFKRSGLTWYGGCVCIFFKIVWFQFWPLDVSKAVELNLQTQDDR